jgi:hypothetical protein
MAGIAELFIVLVALIILWVVVSVPVWIAARIVTSGRQEKASFGEAMGATLAGAIVYALVALVSYVFLHALIGGYAVILAAILAIVAWLGVYKSIFKVGWLGALAIAILAAIVLIILNVILGVLLGVNLPSFFHPF